MIRSESTYVFTFSKLFKSWIKGENAPSVKFHEYTHDTALCMVAALDFYLEHTKHWRSGSGHKRLLLSFAKPHKKVKESAISGWVKKVLKESGVNTEIFKAHSTRSASFSKVGSKIDTLGISLEDILKRGNWSKKSTW